MAFELVTPGGGNVFGDGEASGSFGLIVPGGGSAFGGGGPTERGGYPLAWIATLPPPLAAVVGRAQTPPGGSAPFAVTPGPANTYVQSGIAVYNLGNAAVTSDADTFTLTSGTSAFETAGLFGSDGGGSDGGRIFDRDTGYVLHVRVRVTPSTFGTRGTPITLGTGFGGDFEPSGIQNPIGWLYDSDDPVVDGYWRMVGAAPRVPLGEADPPALRDDAILDCWIVIAAGAASGWMLLANLDDPSAPVTLDTLEFTPPTAAPMYPEVNASPALIDGGPVRTLTVYAFEGCAGYDP